GERLQVAGDRRAADPAIFPMEQQTDAPVPHGGGFVSGIVRAGVFDDVDRVDPRGNSRQHALNGFRRPIGRNDDGDLQALNAHVRSRAALGAVTAAVDAARCGSKRRSAKAAASAAAPRKSSGILSGAARYSAVTRCAPAGISKPMKLGESMKIGLSRSSTRMLQLGR